MNVESKWFLLLPIFHNAYAGLLANVADRETGSVNGSDHSVWESACISALVITVWLWWMFKGPALALIVAVTVAITALVRFSTNLALLKLHRKHYVLWALFSLLPGVMLWNGLVVDASWRV